MTEINWPTVLAILGIMASVFGLFKYLRGQLDDHRQHVDKRFADHGEQIAGNRAAIEQQAVRLDQHKDTLHKRITETREEMHGSFVRHDHLDRKLDEQSKMLAAMFDRVNKIASAVNQLIGAHNGRVISHDDE